MHHAELKSFELKMRILPSDITLLKYGKILTVESKKPLDILFWDR